MKRWCCLGVALLVLAGGLFSFSPEAAAAEKKKIVFVAGRPSHNYGAHEHNAGCALLARCLQEGMPDYEIAIHRGGWPEDASIFDGADAVVVYSDGGDRHPVIPSLAYVDGLAEKRVGIVCIHYAVEVPKGDPGQHFLKWIGGYFETHWSVNPHWTANFEKLPDHPITRGVQPFAIEDEWYYHMRFRDEMQGVTPILTAIPPESTLNRPDGPHSNNPHVRAEKGKPQHVAWAAERPNGGRGFGFTGGHFHWNWGDEDFRRLVLNAIVWTAQGEVPAGGVGDKSVSLRDLEANQDYPPPADFDREDVRKRLKLPADNQGDKKGAEKKEPSGEQGAAARAKPIFRSPLVTPATPGHAVTIDVDIRGAKQLFLVVRDGGDNFSCDWADWAEPTLIGPSGSKQLTELSWRSASADWGQPRINANAGGGPLRIAGKALEFGIGTHANSVIAFDLPEGLTRFQARAGLDNGGTDQEGCGAAASAQFLVYTSDPDIQRPGGDSRDPADAVAALDVAEGLEAKLFASEPTLLSLTNLDIDHRGRIWVCEVVNYRKHNGQRPEGDRILILEDEDGDGRADSTKVFYQGRDIDSAMGLCVLGNKVIVSASPNVFVFTDEDGDDRPDRKEVFFSNTGQPQHDHSAHSFLFGPDGKLYWNFGNTGQRVCDANGQPVVDLAGNQVIDNGKPYWGGMPFRCDLDGGNFEVLAHNFRNNYEVTVDSFGTLWQSDNDDDGNRGVRINYVMEFGNYGYRDEITGAGWQTPRTDMEDEIPLRHWHLNDPGVVPNLLQTGAGSPTGITVYEGRLLPRVFWDQVLHCDAGPNIVRAYPVTKNGAGYQAETVNLLHGARDIWFRPADVCVAPD
jgi:putative membrane-bound dehydrogenase-like protein